MTKDFENKLKEYEKKDVLTVKQVMDILDLSRVQVHYLFKKGKIHPITLCENKHLVLKVDLIHFINENIA